MATLFKHAVVTGIGSTPVDVVQIGEGVRATVVGCNISNITEYDTVNVDVFVIDEYSTEAYFVKNIAIPPQSALKVITQGEKLILPATSGIRVVSDTEDSIDVTVSYVEIS